MPVISESLPCMTFIYNFRHSEDNNNQDSEITEKNGTNNVNIVSISEEGVCIFCGEKNVTDPI